MIDCIFIDRVETLLLPVTVGMKFGRSLISQLIGIGAAIYRDFPNEPHLVELVEVLVEPAVVDRLAVLVFEVLLDDFPVRIATREPGDGQQEVAFEAGYTYERLGLCNCLGLRVTRTHSYSLAASAAMPRSGLEPDAGLTTGRGFVAHRGINSETDNTGQDRRRSRLVRISFEDANFLASCMLRGD